MKALDKLAEEYQARIANYDKLIASTSELLRIARKGHSGSVDDAEERNALANEVRRLNDLRQLCIQVIADLETLDDELSIP